VSWAKIEKLRVGCHMERLFLEMIEMGIHLNPQQKKNKG
jgi:hypothetical protein